MANIFYDDGAGLLAQNRLYCAAATVPTLTDLEEIADALYDVWVAQVMNVAASTWELSGITVRAMNEAEGLIFVDANSYPIQGNIDDSTAGAAQVSYTVTLNTGLAGRSQRGRVYGVGLPNTYHNDKRLTDGGRSNIQSAWELVLTAMETAGHALQVVSFQDGGVVRTEGRALPVLSVNTRFPLATQRRRLS